ncbi:hypothetical protein [Limobrevibacterium gyesilva]|uniref:DUF1360 domain-containing protein n=1 Tax=Limobrevibacterium gyesilva TaxID=2991712 RepID=A0AA41YRJ9_9PROT|nr:hypothetical protein [Limobrevibacterium gyesilva]MCW3474207.1 hypothetical protein [Limobrevibacterium gyesilva]
MSLAWLLVGVLCVWRLTHLLVVEHGPWRVMARLRARLGGGFWAGLFDCFYCLSLWIAAPVAWLVGDGALARLLLWPALSGGAILLERAMAGRTESGTAIYAEDAGAEREGSDGVLR